MSCEFIDSSSVISNTPLNGTLDFEEDESKKFSTKIGKTQRIKKFNLSGFNTITKEPLIENTNESSNIIASSISTSNMTQPFNTNDVVKTVKFKEPLEIDNHASTDFPKKSRNIAEEQLLNALDETLLSANLRSSPSLSNSTNDEESTKADNNEKRINSNRKIGANDQTLKASLSTNNVDKPPKPNVFSFSTNSPITTANATSSLTRTKFAQNKSRTIDFPDLLQDAMDSTNQSTPVNTANNKNSASTSFLSSNTTNLTPNKPIQSILRRSETPPSTKMPTSTSVSNAMSFRQASIESTESSRDRESSIEKKLRITSSTSRPLMFNN